MTLTFLVHSKAKGYLAIFSSLFTQGELRDFLNLTKKQFFNDLGSGFGIKWSQKIRLDHGDRWK